MGRTVLLSAVKAMYWVDVPLNETNMNGSVPPLLQATT